MADLVTNIAKGRFIHYASLPGTTDGLVAVVLEAADIATDDALQDFDTLAALLAGTSTEQTTMGRKPLTNVAVNVDDTANAASFDADDITWTAATGDPTGKLVICYDPDTTTGDDTQIIPLTIHDFAVVPDGTDIVARAHSDGISVESDA